MVGPAKVMNSGVRPGRFFDAGVADVRTRLPNILAIGFMTVWAACSNGPADPDASDVNAADALTDTEATDSAGTDTLRPPTVVDEDFRLLMLRLDNLQQYGSLVLADPRTREWEEGGHPVGVAGAPESPATANPNIDCTAGCFTDPTMKWFAYMESKPGPTEGRQLVVGSLGEGLVFQPIEGAVIPDVTDLAFAGDRLYLSRRMPSCDSEIGTSKVCWVFLRMDLRQPTVLETLFTFPTPQIRQSAHAGHFTVSADGSTIVIQNPRYGELELWVWRQGGSDDPGVLLQVGESICGARRAATESCSSNLGLFTDREPIAVSTDGNLVVLAAIENDQALRLFALDLRDESPDFCRAQLAYVNLAAEGGGFRADAYYNPLTAPFTDIQAGMALVGTGDETELVFVGERKSPNAIGKTGVTTNLAAISADALQKCSDEGLVPLRRITEFQAGNVPANVLITEGGFSVSPGGAFVAFLGTPVLQSDGRPVSESGSQHIEDREAHVTRVDGTTSPVQVTGHLETRTWDLHAVTPPGNGG